MARWPSPLFLLAVVSAPAAARDKPLLFPVAADVAAADVAACVRHMSATGLDPEGLKAEGWQRYEVSDLPERSFLAGTPLYSRGNGVVTGWIGAGELHSGCSIVILPKPMTSLDDLKREISSALAAQPIFEEDGKRGHQVVWSPWKAGGLLVLLTKDPVNSSAIDVVVRAPIQDWETRLPPQPKPLNDPDDSRPLKK